MPVTIQINNRVLSLVHKMSNGVSTATIPDVCKTPTPGGPVPMPYPNIAQSIMLNKGTTTVKGDKMMAAVKGSEFSMSNGDEAGVVGGVKSSTFIKEATWILYSFDVKLQNKNACRLTDKMFHNHENTASLMGVIQSSTGGGGGGDDDDDKYAEYEDMFEERQPRRREQHGKTPRSNIAQNKQFDAAIKEAERQIGRKLDPGEVRRVHDAISKKGFGFDEIVQTALDIFG